MSYVARRAGVAPSLLYTGRRRMLEGGQRAVQADEDVVKERDRVRELETTGRASWSACSAARPWKSRFSSEALDVARVKKPSLQSAIMERSEGRFAMKAAWPARSRSARSNLIERVSRRAPSRVQALSQGQGTTRAIEGADPLAAGGRAPNLRVSAYPAPHKPSAKGRRKAASQCQACAADCVQAKQTGTLERAYRPPARAHACDGVVITLRSNIRWCSDHFELACRNGEIVRVLFAIDACDREVMAWLATSAGISGEMVRDLMVACIERRFGISKAAHPVEWLSDNGSAYIAKDTLDTATALGLSPLAGIQRHRGGIRQNLQTRLCSAVDLAGC